jgi:hypothetical protein
MAQRASEQFTFECQGPYSVVGFETPSSEAKQLEPGVNEKRKAIQRAKTYLKNTHLCMVKVLDANRKEIFSQEQTVDEAIKDNVEIAGYLHLLSRNPVLSPELRHSLLALFAADFGKLFVVSQGELWSPVEDSALELLYSRVGITDPATLSGLLGRTPSAVGNRIKRLEIVPKPTTRPNLFSLKG